MKKNFTWHLCWWGRHSPFTALPTLLSSLSPITRQSRAVPGLHVQVQLGPRAESRPAHGTRRLLVILCLVYPDVLTALLDHQPLPVNIVLLSVRNLSVSGHAFILGKFLLAVSATRGAAECRVMHSHMRLQVTL